jgi:hypothetical protein
MDKETQTQHTPGPWTVERYNTHPHYEIYADGPQRVACAEDHLSESIANARLIAAAPDLLAELGGIADALAEGRTVTIESGSVKAERIRAAIAKAEGR